MPNGKIKQEWEKQAFASFASGIMQALLDRRKEEERRAEEERMYLRGLHDKNYSAKLRYLQKLTEHNDPKIQQFAFEELNKIGAISQVPEQTEYNELAKQFFGLGRGSQTALINRGWAYPEEERVTITPDSRFGKNFPEMRGKSLTSSEMLNYLLEEEKIKTTAAKESQKTKRYEENDRLARLRAEHEVIKTQLRTAPKDRFGRYIGDDPELISLQNRLDILIQQIRGEETLMGLKQAAAKIDQSLEKYLKMKMKDANGK